MISMIDSFKFKYGVEIELFNCKRVDIKKELDKVGISSEVQSYNHNVVGVWKITADGSVTSTGTDMILDFYGEPSIKGIEVVSPVLEGKEGLEQLRKVLCVLNKLGARVDDSCSIHVHLDTTYLDYNDIKNVLIFYYNYQNAIECLIHEDRRNGNNPYCLPIELEQLKKVRKANSLEKMGFYMRTRKKCVNIRSYRRGYNTCEFRQLHGTLSFDEIYNWLMLLQNIMYYCSRVDGILKIHREDDVMKQFNKLNRDLELYKNKRLFKYFISHIENEIGRDE